MSAINVKGTQFGNRTLEIVSINHCCMGEGSASSGGGSVPGWVTTQGSTQNSDCPNTCGTFSVLGWYGHRGIYRWVAPAITNQSVCMGWNVTFSVSPGLEDNDEIVIKSRDLLGTSPAGVGTYQGLPVYEWDSTVRAPAWFSPDQGVREWYRAASTGWMTFTSHFNGSGDISLGHFYGANGRKLPRKVNYEITYDYEVWLYSINGVVLPYGDSGIYVNEVRLG